MTDNKNKDFDELFRSVLHDAAEDVPEHVWGKISDRLPAAPVVPKTARIFPVWAKVCTGIAAAVAFAVLLTITVDSLDSPVRKADILSDNVIVPSASEEEMRGPSDNYPTTAAEASDILTSGPQYGSTMESIDSEEIDTSSNTIIENSSDTIIEESSEIIRIENPKETEKTEEISGIKDPAESTGHTEIEEITAGKSENTESAGDSDFPDFPEDSPKKKVRTSFILSGNAISNSNSSSGNNKSAVKPSFRPGINDLKTDKVTESSASSYGIPFSVGIGAKVEFAKRWSVSAGVNYSLLSRTFSGTYHKVGPDGEYSETPFSSIRNRQDYIGIPVNFYFSIVRTKLLDFYAYAGGTAEKCVSDRYTMSAGGETFRHREKIKGMQFSANAGIGMEFIIANRFGIYLDPSIRYYFKDERQPNSIRTVQPLMFGVELGLRIRL